MEMILMNPEKGNTNELHNLSKRLDSRNSSKHVTLQYNRIKTINAKKIALMWTDEFELPDSFYLVSDNPYYIKHIIKHETSTNPPIYICANRTNNRLVFKIKIDVS